MPWQTLATLLLVALPVLHFWWRKKYLVLQEINTLAEKKREDLQNLCDDIRRESKSQQNALFDSMIEGVLILDQESRVQHANQSLIRLLKLPPGQAEGKTIMETIRIHELAAIIHILEHKGQVMGTEISVPGKRNLILEVNAVATKDAQGNPGGYIMVFHDLTRIRKLENTRREFVANASHELRTPISMIKGYAETLADGAKEDPEALDRFLGTIIKHADRLTLLVEDLLSLSKLESQSEALEISKTNLHALLQSVFDELASRAEKMSVTLVDNIEPGLNLLMDESRIRQVLFNLVENAIKYSGEGKTVTVSSKKGLQNYWEISVADTGQGIPPAALERIFERFYRVDKSRSRESGDTGLGLAIVKHIVQLHGGTVWCESEVGLGSTFFFTLHATAPQTPSGLALSPIQQQDAGNQEFRLASN